MLYPSSSPEESQLVRELSQPIYQAKGWLKFLGILSIIGGITQALTIVGILIAWLPIWLGVLMYQAGSNIESAAQAGDKFSFLRSLGNLKTYFVLQGVLILISIIVPSLIFCVIFILSLFGVTLIPWEELMYNLY
ncbi:MAG: DUF5362 domain-containing protein [Anaerolineales bacterium]|nr:DUF5362 domain-containing protein [Anaerolineales bacterium]MDW8278862.1 DUF5362 family protein [Anaerolineales bacterium]